MLRWIFLVRMSVASALFGAAIVVWSNADPGLTLVASLAFALAALVTAGSVAWGEVYRRPLTPNFFYAQHIADLLLVTAVVHVMAGEPGGGGVSGYSALYILVIATGSLLLPPGGGLLIAALGNVLYVAEVILLRDASASPMLWLQLTVFALVALGSAWLGAQLRRRAHGSGLRVAELEQVRLRAEDILRTIRSGVLTVDELGRLVHGNPMAEQLLGLRLAGREGQLVLDDIAACSPELARALERAARHRQRTLRGEGTIVTGGTSFPVGITTTCLDGAGTRTATAIFQDISDGKRLDALRMRAQRLEGVAELSASLAHEIKNPLASIRSAVEQLSRMPRATPDEQVLATLVLRESDRLSRLLSEFLDFARVRVTQTAPVDVAALVATVARLAAAHPDCPAGVTVQCLVPPGRDTMVEGDGDLLHQAVFNLALNAVQAAPPGTHVTITVTDDADPQLSLVPDAGSEVVVIRVADQGTGIADDIRDRLFDPFFTTRPQGSGLGLAVVHRAIEAHRGLVTVDSTPAGTCFTVALPRTVHSPVAAE
jgi:two-component system, NtrC family, sensor histidine kinase PilS